MLSRQSLPRTSRPRRTPMELRRIRASRAGLRLAVDLWRRVARGRPYYDGAAVREAAWPLRRVLRSFDGDASARDVERLVRALEEFSRALDRVGWMPYDDEKSPRPIDVLCRELARAVAERDDVHARHVAWAIRRACGLHRAGPLL